MGTKGRKQWLDIQDMPAGTQLDRAIAQGFQASCATVFFITENFWDERFLADEINYAKLQERSKGKKFAIIILRFAPEVDIPLLPQPYTWINVKNELEGFARAFARAPH